MFSSADFSRLRRRSESASAEAQRGLLGLHIGCGLHVLDLGQQLALPDVVAFLHQNLGEIAHGVGADIDVVLRLDLARSGDDAGQILAHHAAGLHRDHAALAVNGARVDARPASTSTAATVMIIFHLVFTTQNLPCPCHLH